MNLNDYLKFALKTAVFPNVTDNWQYTVIGLGGEMGEVMNILKKVMRDDNYKITEDKQLKLIEELGDVFWYLIILCYQLKIDPDLILEMNIVKLTERMKNNTIHDQGRKEI